MLYFPRLKQITDTAQRQQFSTDYEAASGLPIPDSYLLQPSNQVFGLYFKRKLVGGFILGQTPKFRTIEVFSKQVRHPELLNEMGDVNDYTEICCFFIKRQYRTHTRLNFATWIGMTYAIRRYGKGNFVFGTCSRPLARLYSQTHETVPFHEDFMNGKHTYIFRAARRNCVKGMIAIMRHKLGRVWKVRRFSMIWA